MANKVQRNHLGSLMDCLVQHEPKIHYAQVRPMRSGTIHNFTELLNAIHSPAGLAMDCSESVTLLCKLAGLGDPNGPSAYDGQGNTETMLAALPHYSNPRNAMTGALVIFGKSYASRHVCMVRTPGSDPLLFSHGQERGPIFIRLSEERKYHSGPVTFLSIAHL